MEQPVQKQHAALLAQIQREQPLKGLHIHAGQIPDALGIAHDHLLQPLGLHRAQYPLPASLPNLFHGFIASLLLRRLGPLSKSLSPS